MQTDADVEIRVETEGWIGDAVVMRACAYCGDSPAVAVSLGYPACAGCASLPRDAAAEMTTAILDLDFAMPHDAWDACMDRIRAAIADVN